jgi:asparagine synthase (glutamine-hydrolysing)
MCGIAGWLVSKEGNIPQLRSTLSQMCEAMLKRGPDAEGIWVDNSGSAGLGHRRLAILDLDQRANQPLLSMCGRFSIVFNGEIYNFRQLREQCIKRGLYFRTDSDTELILTLYADEGTNMLRKLRGMFAFGIWDMEEKELFLARDPYGIKPLYFSSTENGFVFASQVKALMSSGLISSDVDPMGQASFWLFGSVAEPFTWFKEVKPLPAGTWMRVRLGCTSQSLAPTSYWKISDSWLAACANQIKPRAIFREVQDALLESTRYHLVSDVPLGIFLSGGIDSGALAGMIRECTAQQFLGITIAYEEFQHSHNDETPVAAEIAKLYGIKHCVRTVTKEEFLADLDEIFDSMDQPSIDGINTWYAAKAASEQGLKVVLSGIGGDELFLGYTSFQTLPRLVKLFRFITALPFGQSLTQLAFSAKARFSRNPRWAHAPSLLQTMSGAWWLRRGTATIEDIENVMPPEICGLARKLFKPDSWIGSIIPRKARQAELELAQIESSMYLRNQLLRDSDWASMAHGVELRTPLVDAFLLDKLSAYLPHFHLFKNKLLLAHAPSQKLPDSIIRRQKTGFGIPVKRWVSENLAESSNPRLSWLEFVASGYSKSLVK